MAAPSGPGRRGLLAKRLAVVGMVGLALALVTVMVFVQTNDVVLIGYWCLGSAVILACLVAFVVGRRFTSLPIAPGRVLCIVPAYNESQEGLDATVRALLAQTVPVDIVVIDDGSKVPVVPTIEHPRLTWLRQENTGKRGAQVHVLRRFDRDDYQYILTVDSDSEPFPDACEQLLRAMSNDRVQAATGMIYIRNFSESWVSRAADMDIGTSCVMMRASRSMLGSLETTSGALALYRSELLYDHLDAYAVECGTGDDRWLALRALRRGEVVGVAEAGVVTDMPATFHGTYRQRLRWARSWWWMLPYVFRYLSVKQMLSPAYGLLQLAFTPIFMVWVAVALVVTHGARYEGHPLTVGAYLLAYLIVRFGVAALYLVGRPGQSRSEKVKSLAVGTPASVFLNMVLLMPTRYFALFKLFDNRWQTRESAPVTRFVPTGAPVGIPADSAGPAMVPAT